MIKIYGILLLTLLITACQPEDGSSHTPEPPSPTKEKVHLLFQLDASEAIINTEFDINRRYESDFENNFTFNSYHVVTSEGGHDYSVDLFFVKTAVSTWQVFAAYNQTVTPAHTLKFTPLGMFDSEASALANSVENYSPLIYPFEMGPSGNIDTLNVEIDFSLTTQLALPFSKEIVLAEKAPSVTMPPPVATEYVSLSANLDATEHVPVIATFDVSNTSTYNHSTVVTVYDPLGLEHTLSLYFRKNSVNHWSLFLQLSDSGSDEDGIAERVDTGEENVELYFSPYGRLIDINHTSSSPLNFSWSINTGAIETLTLQLIPMRISQYGIDFTRDIQQGQDFNNNEAWPVGPRIYVATTSQIRINANLDSREVPPVVLPFDPTDTYTYTHSTALTVFDSLRIAHTASLYFVKTAVNHWSFYITVPDGLGGVTQSSEVALVFDTAGLLFSVNGTSPALIDLEAVFGDTFPTNSGAYDLSLSIAFYRTTQYGAEFSRTLWQDGGEYSY